jgi:hypothetical protein
VVEQEKFKVTIKNDDLTIDMPEDTFYVEGIQIAKRGIALDIQKYLPALIQTQFVETFKAEPKPVDMAPPIIGPQMVSTPELTDMSASATDETNSAESAQNTTITPPADSTA